MSKRVKELSEENKSFVGIKSGFIIYGKYPSEMLFEKYRDIL